MESPTTRLHGYALAALGATGLAASLWTPWYSFQIPQSLIDQTVGVANQMGALGQFITRSAELLRVLGPFHVNAWQVFTTVPALLLVISVIGGGLSLLALSGRATGVGQVIAGAGAAGLLLVLYRVAERPGPSSIMHLSWGLYLALGAALAVLAGGLLTVKAESAAESEQFAPYSLPGAEPSPAAWPASDSLAPPGL